MVAISSRHRSNGSNQSTNGATMQTNKLTRHESAPKIPSRQALERLRVYQVIQSREREITRKKNAARRALSAANKLKNSVQKKYHQARILRALNQLRAAA